MIVKSKALNKILPLPHNSKFILHDYWTALVVSKFGKIDFIDEPLVKYRQHIDNEVGSSRKSDSINDFYEMRNLFIEVKLEHFKTFLQNQDVFEDEKINKLNKMAYEYYENLKKVKKISLKGSFLF